MRPAPFMLALAAIGGVAACRAPRMPEAVTTTLTAATPTCAAIHLSMGIDVVVLGSGGPRSAGRAASSFLVAVDGIPRMLVDAGPGAFVRLGETGLSTERLDTILLTHLHVDHAGDVPGLVKSRDLLGDGDLAFRVVGPSGRGTYPSTTVFVDRLFGPQGAFAYLPSFRNPLRIEPTDLPIDVDASPRSISAEGGVVVTSIAVDHGDVPAVAYRIERGGHAVVFSGDLASRRGRIQDFAYGADLLVYDAAVLDPPGSPAELYALHTPPDRIGEIAASADVKHLVLAHVSPAVDQHRADVLASVRRSYREDVRFAADCMHLTMGHAR